MNKRLFFKSFGERTNPPVVILHGWGIDGSNFYTLAELLSKHFYIMVPDLPGFGQSAEPQSPWAVSDYAKTILSFLSEQNIRSTSLIGHSFGGQTAIVMAAMAPNRITNLIITGASGVEAPNLKRSTKRTIYLVASKILKWFTFIPAIQKLKDRFYKNRDYNKVTGVMRQTFKKVIKERQNKACKKIECPTYLLWGNNDQLVPVQDADLINSLLPKSKLKIFANVGHKLPYAKPHEFAKEVETFLVHGGNESGMS
jgi:pimeloyl-ACP methyl ester carboxylesterase